MVPGSSYGSERLTCWTCPCSTDSIIFFTMLSHRT